jgi:hypothetical protein
MNNEEITIYKKEIALGRTVARLGFNQAPCLELGHASSAWGPFSLATDRLMVYLALAIDNLTLNINIYSDR